MSINKDIKIEDLKKLFKPSGRYGNWRIISLLITGIIAGSALFVIYFVYQNIYTTLANTNTIVILESGLNVDSIDTRAYNQVEEKLKLKASFFVWPDKIRNIFEYVTIITTTPINTAKKK